MQISYWNFRRHKAHAKSRANGETMKGNNDEKIIYFSQFYSHHFSYCKMFTPKNLETKVDNINFVLFIALLKNFVNIKLTRNEVNGATMTLQF